MPFRHLTASSAIVPIPSERRSSGHASRTPAVSASVGLVRIGPMELRELRYFVAVAEMQSFSRASSRLGVAQPTLSRQIRGMETELRTPLFYRDGRGVRLTDAGRRLRDSIVPLIRQLDDVCEEIAETGGHPRGEVRIGVPPSVGGTIAAGLVQRFLAEAPDARIRLREGFSGTLLEWVEAGSIDVGILYDARRQPNMLVTPVLVEDLFVIGPAGENAPNDDTPTPLAALDGEKLMLPGKGNGLRRVVDAAIERAGIAIDVAAEVDSTAVLKQLVEKRLTRTILPFGAVHREVFEGRLVAARLVEPEVRAKLVMVTALNRPITRATRLLMDIVRQEFGRCVAEGALRGQTTDLD